MAGGKKNDEAVAKGKSDHMTNIKVKSRFNITKKTIKFLLAILAKLINYLGYLFPKKAEYQFGLQKKEVFSSVKIAKTRDQKAIN